MCQRQEVNRHRYPSLLFGTCLVKGTFVVILLHELMLCTFLLAWLARSLQIFFETFLFWHFSSSLNLFSFSIPPILIDKPMLVKPVFAMDRTAETPTQFVLPCLAWYEATLLSSMLRIPPLHLIHPYRQRQAVLLRHLPRVLRESHKVNIMSLQHQPALSILPSPITSFLSCSASNWCDSSFRCSRRSCLCRSASSSSSAIRSFSSTVALRSLWQEWWAVE